jgi:hypothetical protein
MLGLPPIVRTDPDKSIPAGIRIVRFAERIMSNPFRASDPLMKTPILICCEGEVTGPLKAGTIVGQGDVAAWPTAGSCRQTLPVTAWTIERSDGLAKVARRSSDRISNDVVGFRNTALRQEKVNIRYKLSPTKDDTDGNLKLHQKSCRFPLSR